MQVDLSNFEKQIAAFAADVARSGVNTSDRFQLFRDYDPFETIPPALLNAGHLATYAIATGMIEPFESTQLTKPATYLVKVEGECRYRDEDGNLVSFYLSKDPHARIHHLEVREKVRLAPNSVCFLTLAPEFRMPAYIGARFNLLIRDVYRGLLVGTGPLVDPGFSGRLSIPIHNFTNREYFIDAGEGLVYFEFTKLTWSNPSPPRQSPSWMPRPIIDQPPFPASKASRRTLDDYLNAATGSGPPESAIGQTMANMRTTAERANGLLTYYSLGGLIAAFALLYTAWSVYVGAQQFTASAQAELRESRTRLANEIMSVRAKQDELDKKMESIQSTPPIASEPMDQHGTAPNNPAAIGPQPPSGGGTTSSGLGGAH